MFAYLSNCRTISFFVFVFLLYFLPVVNYESIPASTFVTVNQGFYLKLSVLQRQCSI